MTALTKLRAVTIRSRVGILSAEDICNACPAGCELAVAPTRGLVDRDLVLRRGWTVELLTADDDEPSSDEWALLLGRLLLVDPEMRVELTAGGH